MASPLSGDMLHKKTHREVKNPQISARYLADYMAASERAGRTIVRNCKYQPIARVVQHDEAKIVVAKFIREGSHDPHDLLQRAQHIRNRIADSDFERDLYDHNADYIARFAEVFEELELPDVELLSGGGPSPLFLNGVKVNTEIHWRLRRITRTNKVRVGASMLRYAKGKALSPDVAEWQSAFLFGYLNKIGVEDAAEPEHRLCITVDAYSGICYPAPTDSIRRFQNMEAACESIAERWPVIKPPSNAVL